MSDIIPCNSNADCSYLYNCQLLDQQKQCVHDPLFTASPLVITAFILLPILIGIGNVGGLGGGITKVPIMMIMLNYNQRIATYQAYCIQFGACLSNAFLLFNQRHPNKDRPLIDYNLGLIIVPVVMLGTTMGIYVNTFAPEIASNVLFIVFLISIMPYLFNKSMRLRKEELKVKKDKLLQDEEQIQDQEKSEPQIFENDQKEQVKKMGTIQDQSESGDSVNNNKQNLPSYIKLDANQQDDELKVDDQNNQINYKNEQILKIINTEKKYIPLLKFGIITSSFLIVQLINFIIGTKSIPSIVGFPTCGVGYWIFTALLPVSTVALSFAAWIILSKEEAIKQKYGYDYDKDDLPFNKNNFGKIWAAGFCAGFLAGALGAGGGLSLVTFLMALNLNSRVASATTGMNNLFIGFTSFLSVATNEVISWGEIGVFIGVSLIGGLIFSKIIYYFVQKYNKTSLIVMFVFGLCIVNILSNIGYIVKTVVESGSWQPLLETQSLCPPKTDEL